MQHPVWFGVSVFLCLLLLAYNGGVDNMLRCWDHWRAGRRAR